ncbi:MAG: DUF1553 domain-containing protein, partial [Fimbriiglobus sp.]
ADPISQVEYFGLQAFFAPMLPRDDTVLLPPADRAAYLKKLAAWQAATKPVREEIDRMLTPYREAVAGEIIVSLDADTQKALKMPESQRSPVQWQLARLGGKQVGRRTARADRRLTPEQRVRYDELLKNLAGFDKLKPEPPPTAMAVADVGTEPPPVHRLAGGNLGRPKEPVAPHVPNVLGRGVGTIATPDHRPESTGRRSALATWVTRPDHPMTARVIVNRLWATHTGRGIVATPSDFGEMGADPTHPDLLDWLAAELVGNGWSLKAIHRLIVTSATYRQTSDPGPTTTATVSRKIDPENHLLWHARVKRRDGEAVRDAALQAAGALNPTMFGPSCKPELPPALWEARSAWTPDANPADRRRRSVYVYHSRNLPYPLFQAFDAPSRMETCPVRPTTTSPVQALVLLNGEFLNEQSRLTAGEVLARGKKPAAVVRVSYQRVLGRAPTSEEMTAAEAFLREQSREIAADGVPTADTLPEPMPPDVPPPTAAAVVDLVHALMNSTEFLYVE